VFCNLCCRWPVLKILYVFFPFLSLTFRLPLASPSSPRASFLICKKEVHVATHQCFIQSINDDEDDPKMKRVARDEVNGRPFVEPSPDDPDQRVLAYSLAVASPLPCLNLYKRHHFNCFDFTYACMDMLLQHSLTTRSDFSGIGVEFVWNR
jgi:hypothetical protein